jgi:hypothetical protein
MTPGGHLRVTRQARRLVWPSMICGLFGLMCNSCIEVVKTVRQDAFCMPDN